MSQTVLCFADDTIERPVKGANGIEAIDGSNALRKCRPSKRVYELYAAQAWKHVE